MTPPNARVAYVRWAAVATVVCYSAGYATIGFGLMFFGAAWSLLRRRSFPWRQTPLDPPLAVFGIVLLVSAIASPYRSIALIVTPALLLSGAIYFGSFAWLLEHDPASRMTLLRAWALGAPPAALAGLATVVLGHAERASIPRGVGPNGLGTTLLLGGLLALGLGLAPRRRLWERIAWAACAAVVFAGLLASGSRASLLGWLVGALWLGWHRLRPRARAAAAVVAAALVAVGVAAAVSPDVYDATLGPLLARAEDVAPDMTDRVLNAPYDIAGNRLKIWGTSLRMLASSPWLGTGFGTFEAAYAHWKDPDMSSEPFAFNLALNLAVETGVLGLYAAAWVAQAGIAEWRRWGRALQPGRTDPSRPIVAALWVGLLVDQLADNTLFSISTSAALWLLLAYLAVPGRPAANGASGRAVPSRRGASIEPSAAGMVP
ncbi:MAG TPA: O-antigen ligase family protein [bacterium]|nr:O-antigen ligase family protein [bacterium]